MKKFFAVLIALVVAVGANVCSANHYDDDPDYTYVTTSQQGTYYLYLPSIDVQEYNPPHYQIAGNFFTIGGKKIISEIWRICVIRYNWYTKETYHRNDHGNWIKDNINDKYNRRIADALFRAAYGMKFYD